MFLNNNMDMKNKFKIRLPVDSVNAPLYLGLNTKRKLFKVFFKKKRPLF